MISIPFPLIFLNQIKNNMNKNNLTFGTVPFNYFYLLFFLMYTICYTFKFLLIFYFTILLLLLYKITFFDKKTK